nr:unnamed protein product [Anser cygnoides domesticus]
MLPSESMTCLFLGFPELAKIWASASYYLSQQLALHQAVRIPGLGTFTVVTEQVASQKNDIVTVERPMFHLAKAIVHNHDLRYDYIDIPGRTTED